MGDFLSNNKNIIDDISKYVNEKYYTIKNCGQKLKNKVEDIVETILYKLEIHFRI